MDNTVENKTTINFIVIFVMLLSFTAIYISHTSGYMLAYNDATAHLNTARRIVDNLTPGLVQIGSVWLPMLHILELPFAANFYLWQTGFAGAIVSSVSFLIANVYLFRLLILTTKKIWVGIIGVLVFATNLNLLYLQTTAMFEPLLMATALAAVYYLSRWAINGKINDLVLSAFAIMLATLTRYDGWALFIASVAIVFLIGAFSKKRSGSGPAVIFLTLAGFGIFLWLLYNKMIFDNALYFANSEFSAKAQQEILASRGQLATKGDIKLSFLTYTYTSIFNLGILPFFTMVAGVFYYLIRYVFSPSRWPPFLLVIPYFFNIISLYTGQSVIWLPMLPPNFSTYFNARYGILMLPAAAFFVAFMSGIHKLLVIPIILLLIIQTYLFVVPKALPLFGKEIGMVTLQDTVSSVNKQTIEGSRFLHNNHDGGLIMVSSASADAFIFRAGLPLKYFITEGTGKYWKESLDNPAKYASWIVFFRDRSDRVGIKVPRSQIFKNSFNKVYEDQTYEIWRKN